MQHQHPGLRNGPRLVKKLIRFQGRGIYPTEGSCRFPLIVLQKTTQSLLATHNPVIPARASIQREYLWDNCPRRRPSTNFAHRFSGGRASRTPWVPRAQLTSPKSPLIQSNVCIAPPAPCIYQGMPNIVEMLKQMSKAPEDQDAFNRWLHMQDAVEFLRLNLNHEEFVVYSNTQHCFMHTVAVPSTLVDPPNVDDLLRWNCDAYSGWGIAIGFAPPSVEVVPPLHNSGSITIDRGEKLIFARSFEGRLGQTHYYDILPKYLHISELHFLRERNAYSKFDEHGDIEDGIRIIEVPADREAYGGTIITFKRAQLDEYLAITDSVIIRMFDFMRLRLARFGGWSGEHNVQHVEDEDLFYRFHMESGHASYMRGCQLVSPGISKDSVIARYSGPTEGKEYATFLAHDWKNDEVKEISCGPGCTANYFTPSDLPFELSPAFFRAEVLSKYKMDSEKYRLEQRSITCRGAWHLQSYDVNEAGQVHTYLIYLRSLPYAEQIYWKSYNEAPKGPLSRRALKTDFEGSWESDYEPLGSITDAIRTMTAEAVPWWTLRSEALLGQLHYPVTSSADEWANELLVFDQLLVEGFETKWLRTKAQSLGRTPDQQFASLKLLAECLIGFGICADDVGKVVTPLRKLHELRSKLKGHASGNEALAVRGGRI